jgi:hypothetical protein
MKMRALMMICFASLLVGKMSAQDLHHESANGNITPYHDAKDFMNGVHGGKYNADSKWQNFLQNHPTWGGMFTAYNNMPHRATGPGIATSGSTFVNRAINFMQTELAQYNIPVNNLELTSQTTYKQYTNLNFKQSINGKEILWSRITFRFTPDGKVVLFGIDAYANNTPIVAEQISASQAQTAAQNSLEHTTITGTTISSTTKYIPLPNEQGATKLEPVYEVVIDAMEDTGFPGQYYTLVSANSGEVLYRSNRVVSVTGKIQGPTKVMNNWSPMVYKGLPYTKMVVNGTTYTTDSVGDITIPGGTATGTLSLDGTYCRTRMNAAQSTPLSYTATLSGATLDFDTAAINQSYRPVNVFYHTSYMHDFMKKRLGAAFTDLDVALPAYVDNNTQTCNAFYNGTSINFYDAGGGCNATSTIADVIYHEYGHGITNRFWDQIGNINFDNGAVGEGYSDMWAMGITNHPVIGPGFYSNSSTTGIREYNAAPKVYPYDIVGEVHADGEIIAGAWWDAYQNWGSLDSLHQVFADSHYGLANGPDGAEGQVYYDILLDALNYDDDDANISNGTPHFLPIVQAFARHGIFLNMYSTLAHTSPHTIPANTSVTIDATITPQFPVFVGDVKMYYRRKPGIGITALRDSILMTNSMGFNYTATFPAKQDADLYEYYFGAFDSYSPSVAAVNARRNCNFNILSSQRNIFYHLLFGMQQHVVENFENGATGWSAGIASDDATAAGKWIIATPIGSIINGQTVQTDKDHTTGGGKCAVTGNASSAGSGAGAADIDGGVTTLQSPVYNLSEVQNPYISFYRWFSNSQGSSPRSDEFRVVITDNGGVTWKSIDRTFQPEVGWSRMVYRLSDYGFSVNASSIQFRVYAVDSASTGSLVEAAFDDFEILGTNTPAVTPPASLGDNAAVQVQIFPNPAQTEFTAHLSTPSTGTLQLYNTVGQEVYSHRFDNAKTLLVDVAALTPGVYQMRITANGTKLGMKSIVVQR